MKKGIFSKLFGSKRSKSTKIAPGDSIHQDGDGQDLSDNPENENLMDNTTQVVIFINALTVLGRSSPTASVFRRRPIGQPIQEDYATYLEKSRSQLSGKTVSVEFVFKLERIGAAFDLTIVICSGGTVTAPIELK